MTGGLTPRWWWCLWLWWAGCAHAGVLQLSPGFGQARLLGHFEVLQDAEAAQAAATVWEHPGWRLAQSTDLNRGSTAAVWWWRVVLQNPSPEPITVWLTFDNPRLEQVERFPWDAQAMAWGPPERSGVIHPAQVPEVRGLDAAFALRLPAGESTPVLLRLQSRTVLKAYPVLWEPLAYLDDRENEDLWYLLPMVLLCGLALYLLVNAWALDNRELAFLAVWLLCAAIYDFAFAGYLRRYLWPDGGEVALRSPHAIGLVTTAMLACYLRRYLEIARQGLWRLFLRGMAAWLLFCALMTLLADLRWAIRVSVVSLAFFYLLWPWAVWRSWWRGQAQMRWAALGMLVIWCLTAFRVLLVFGDAEVSALETLYLAVVFKLLMAVVLLSSVLQRQAAQARALAATQTELLGLEQRQQRQLEETVVLRSAELRAAAVRADEAARAKTQLLAHVGHDLRAPLATIIGYTARLQTLSVPPHAVALAAALEHRARDLTQIINRLLDYARVGAQSQAWHPRSVYLAAFARHTVQQAQQLAWGQQRHLEIRTLGEWPAVVETDPKRLQQVLSWLLTHAAQVEGGQRVVLSLAVSPATVPGGSGSFLSFTVHDDGPGMDKADLAALFLPFWGQGALVAQADVRLALAQEWVSRMGGRLRARSRLGHGTSLRLQLPIGRVTESDMDPAHWLVRHGTKPDWHANGRVLWLADPCVGLGVCLQSALSEWGWVVRVFADAQALESAWLDLAEGQAPAALLLDTELRAADGRAASASMAELAPLLPQVLWSARCRRGLEEIPAEVLQKPIDLSLLLERLGERLGLSSRGGA